MVPSKHHCFIAAVFVLYFPRLSNDQAARLRHRSARSRISLPSDPSPRTASISSARNCRRHARRLSAWLGRRGLSSQGEALRWPTNPSSS